MSLLPIIASFGRQHLTDPTGGIINDPFNGSALGSAWTVNNPSGQNITVANGMVRLQGLGSSKNASQHLRYSGYGNSTLRNYVAENRFILNAMGTNGYGVVIGNKSMRPITSNYPSGWGVVDFINGLLQICGGEADDSFMVASSANLTVPINIGDDYLLRFTMQEGSSSVYFQNITRGASQMVSFTYGFLPSNCIPLRPNLFQYAFGVMGTTDISVKYFMTTTTEQKVIKGVFIGDSITVASFAGNISGGYAELLQAATTDRWQIMAGQGNTTGDVLSNMTEILAAAPQYAIICIGTNDGGSSAAFTQLQSVISQLNNAGIQTIPLLIPNGGAPGTAGTFNNSIATTYASTYIDNYTNGWAVWAGTSDMADSVHPSATGHTKFKAIVKAAKPTLFPN